MYPPTALANSFCIESIVYYTTTSGVAVADEVSVSKKGDEPGLLGPNGLLATPHVKMVLFLTCIISVRSLNLLT